MSTNEDDFAAWLLQQAAWLRQGQFSRLDAVRLADEIEGLSADQMELIDNGLTTILKHMLKRDYLPQGSRDNWAGEVDFQQTFVTRVLMRSPSLYAHAESELADFYTAARRAAAGETGCPEDRFPLYIPWSMDKILISTSGEKNNSNR
jgi:hypothetical protein